MYERIADLGLPIFLHPMMINNERLKQYYLINLLGNPFDTAIAAAHLIFGGVLDALPETRGEPAARRRRAADPARAASTAASRSAASARPSRSRRANT